MRHTLTPGPGDSITVSDDWGFADGIKIVSRSDDTIIYVLTDERIAEFRAALDRIEADHARRRAEYDRESDVDDEPELAGFEEEVA
jgi:hypothetical protein